MDFVKNILFCRRRLSTPELDPIMWNGNSIPEVHRLPPPSSPFVTRIPSPLPEQLNQNKEEINLNYVRCKSYFLRILYCKLN